MGNQHIGIGVDIVSIAKFNMYGKSNMRVWLNKVYTDKEQKHCISKRFPAQHFAVRYAAKQAIVKALTTLGITGIIYREIEITNNHSRVPKVIIYSNKLQNYKIEISLSHDETKAIAMALVLKGE